MKLNRRPLNICFSTIGCLSQDGPSRHHVASLALKMIPSYCTTCTAVMVISTGVVAMVFSLGR
eukprot:scaffold445_cov137-Skeletonema_dohrnii-CCMP3373.AAC.4